MAKVALTRAAALTGKSPSTIHRAMRKGRLSYETDAHGSRLVDVSELERVFGLLPPSASLRKGDPLVHMDGAQSVQERIEIEVSRVKIATLEQRVRELAEQHDQLREDRDRWRAQAERLLTDQRETAQSTPVRRRRWWLLGARA